MKTSSKKGLIIAGIITLVIVAVFAYLFVSGDANKIKGKIEFFEGTQNNTTPLNETPEDQLMAKTPDSSYKFKNYFLENKPTVAPVIKTEVTHMLPTGILESDLIMSKEKEIRFSEKDKNTDEVIDHYRLKPSSDNVGQHLKLDMKGVGERGKTNAFQIWGKTCPATGDCSSESHKLHDFTDKPSYVIKGPDGSKKHELYPEGSAEHSGNMHLGGRIGATDINVRNRIYFTEAGGFNDSNPATGTNRQFYDFHNTDPMFIEKKRHAYNKNSLRITINDDKDDTLEVYGGSYYYDRDGRGEGRKLMELNANGNLWTKSTVNTQDVNVRGRIYFSQANNNDVLDPLKANWHRVHNTDPYYIEKITYYRDRWGIRKEATQAEKATKYGTNESALRITMNDDGARQHSNTRENIEIYANSCGSSGGCRGKGSKIMNIRSDGRVDIYGSLYVNNKKVKTD